MNKERLQEALQFARENGLPSITVDGITMPVPKVPEPSRELTEDEINYIAMYNDYDNLTFKEIAAKFQQTVNKEKIDELEEK